MSKHDCRLICGIILMPILLSGCGLFGGDDVSYFVRASLNNGNTVTHTSITCQYNEMNDTLVIVAYKQDPYSGITIIIDGLHPGARSIADDAGIKLTTNNINYIGHSGTINVKKVGDPGGTVEGTFEALVRPHTEPPDIPLVGEFYVKRLR